MEIQKRDHKFQKRAQPLFERTLTTEKLMKSRYSKPNVWFRPRRNPLNDWENLRSLREFN
ncbi:hypothetical protein AAC03nite_25610 [Alicyclobacillus acidoterrestris]|nr:hypothetical protein AAC03nite_25610 [Alicyclobacillus acidoterrestris]